MKLTEQIALALQAYQELKAEFHPSEQVSEPETSVYPEEITAFLDAIPRGWLPVGIADDGEPVLFNLYDSAVGPLLIVGDRNSGKTTLLQSLARYADLLDDPGDVQFAVITGCLPEWRGFSKSPGNMGIWPLYSTATVDFIEDLLDWAKGYSGSRYLILLLIDDLKSLLVTRQEVREALSWLLQNGSAHGIVTVASLNTAKALTIPTWVDVFQNRIFGRIEQNHAAQEISGDTQVRLDDLLPGQQFVLQQASNWLHFWIPVFNGENNRRVK